MQCLADRIPSLVSGNKNIPLVTDEEVGIKVVSCDISDINKPFYYTDVHSGLKNIYQWLFGCVVGTTQSMQQRCG